MRSVWWILLLCVAAPAGAAEFVVSASVGQAAVDVAGYNEPVSKAIELQYNFSAPVGVALGKRYFDDFTISGVSSGRLSLETLELVLVGNIPVATRLSLHPRLGYLKYDLAAYSLGSKVGEDDDACLTLGIAARFHLAQHFALMVEAGRAMDVSDAQIDWLTAGIAIGF